jgi:hypothetical protein
VLLAPALPVMQLQQRLQLREHVSWRMPAVSAWQLLLAACCCCVLQSC